MLQLDLPFHLAEYPDGVFLRKSRTDLHRLRTDQLILKGLQIAVETRGRTYAFSSDGPPQPDHPGEGRGAIWPRGFWPLIDGMSIEQQMLLPARGNALAISWRLVGHGLRPARLTVSPVFCASQPFLPTGFEVEPERDGGRLSWRPLDHSSKIIADTNGCISRKTIPHPSGAVPASFEFNLGPRQAILILSAEPHSVVDTDPLVGAFLAQLSGQGATTMSCDHQRNLAAA